MNHFTPSISWLMKGYQFSVCLCVCVGVSSFIDDVHIHWHQHANVAIFHHWITKRKYFEYSFLKKSTLETWNNWKTEYKINKLFLRVFFSGTLLWFQNIKPPNNKQHLFENTITFLRFFIATIFHSFEICNFSVRNEYM